MNKAKITKTQMQSKIEEIAKQNADRRYENGSRGENRSTPREQERQMQQVLNRFGSAFAKNAYVPFFQNEYWPSPMSISENHTHFWKQVADKTPAYFTPEYIHGERTQYIGSMEYNPRTNKDEYTSFLPDTVTDEQLTTFATCVANVLAEAGSTPVGQCPAKRSLGGGKTEQQNDKHDRKLICDSGMSWDECYKIMCNVNCYAMTQGTEDILWATSGVWGIVRGFLLMIFLATVAFMWEFMRNS